MTALENRVQIFEGMLSAMIHTDNEWRGNELGKLLTFERVCELAFRFRELIAPLYTVSDGDFYKILGRVMDSTTLAG